MVLNWTTTSLGVGAYLVMLQGEAGDYWQKLCVLLGTELALHLGHGLLGLWLHGLSKSKAEQSHSRHG